MFTLKKLTPQHIHELLNCRRLPARLSTSEVAAVLGFQDHDIAPITASKLLTPLGRPAQNAPKYFATVEILALAQDPTWRSQATRVLAKHWQGKNGRRKLSSSHRISPEAVTV